MPKCRVITVSDRCAAGVRTDVSGPAVAEALAAAGHDADNVVVPDGAEAVQAALLAALDAGARLIVTTGGTGVGPRDRTPEGTRMVVDRELPGVAELLRSAGAEKSVHAALTRGIAGVVDAVDGVGGALVVNLPGSPRAALEGVEVVLPLVAHVLDQLTGGDH
jgi:molybdenum cofactor synthesis domain-containing protein